MGENHEQREPLPTFLRDTFVKLFVDRSYRKRLNIGREVTESFVMPNSARPW